MLHQQQNLVRRFGISEMHLSPQWLWVLSVLRRWFFLVEALNGKFDLLYCQNIQCLIVYILFKIYIIHVQISGCSVKACLSSERGIIIKSSHYKTRINPQPGEHNKCQLESQQLNCTYVLIVYKEMLSNKKVSASHIF